MESLPNIWTPKNGSAGSLAGFLCPRSGACGRAELFGRFDTPAPKKLDY